MRFHFLNQKGVSHLEDHGKKKHPEKGGLKDIHSFAQNAALSFSFITSFLSLKVRRECINVTFSFSNNLISD